MYWNSFAEFLAMGKHGVYVWGSFAVMALVMIAEPLIVVQGQKRVIARLKRQMQAARQRPFGGGAVHRGNEQFIRPEEILARSAHRDLQRRKHRLVKAPAGGKIARHDLDMVDQAAANDSVGFHMISSRRA